MANIHQNQTQCIYYVNLSQSYLLYAPIPHSGILRASNIRRPHAGEAVLVVRRKGGHLYTCNGSHL